MNLDPFLTRLLHYVGKSSLLNRLCGKERSIVSEIAGTTRDTVDALVTRSKRMYRIVDTAGIRKRAKVHNGAEFFMVNRYVHHYRVVG
jgi:GTP-binding protein